MNNNPRRDLLKKSLAHLLSVFVLMSGAFSGADFLGIVETREVNAAALGADIQQGDIIEFHSGNWSQEYIVLNPTLTNTEADGTFVLSKDYKVKTTFGDPDYDADPATANIWENSVAQNWCTNYYNNLPDSIRNSIIGVRTHETESGYHYSEVNNIDGTRTGADSSKDKVFFLSLGEFETYKTAAMKNVDETWLLRTPGSDCTPDLKVYVSVVLGDGDIKNVGTSMPYNLGARPAFNIDLPEELCASRSEEGGDTVWSIDADNMEHSYGSASYVWSDDKSTCTAEASCGICNETISETVRTSVSTYKEATADAFGIDRFTAEFKNEAFETQIKDGGTSHSYGEPEYIWSDNNESCTAISKCKLHDDELKETVQTQSEITKEAALNEKGEKAYTAKFVNPLFKVQTKTVSFDSDNKKLNVGDHLYIGRKNVTGFTGIPYWRILDKDKEGNYLLMSEYLWTGKDSNDFIKFKENAESGPAWQGSDAQAWCKAFEKAILDGTDGVTIKEMTKSDAAWHSDFGEIVFAASNNILNKDKVFFLSAEEVYKYMPNREDRIAYLHDGNKRGKTESWWLRSPRDYPKSECAGRVLSLGVDVGAVGRSPISNKGAARPAFWAKLDGFDASDVVQDDEPAAPSGSGGGKDLTTDLAPARINAKNEIKTYRNAKAKANYDAEGNAALDTAMSSGYKAIEAAKTENDINTAVANAKKTIDSVKTIAQKEAEKKQQEEAKKKQEEAKKKQQEEAKKKQEAAKKQQEANKKKQAAAALAKKIATGTTHKVSGSTYKVISPKSQTVRLTKARNIKSLTIPASVKLHGKTFKVVQVDAKALTGAKIRTVTIGVNVKTIKANAFAKSKATNVIVKSKLLKKAGIKGCLKSSNVKTVQIKVGNKTQNKKYVKSYKKIFTKKIAGRKVTVK